MKKIYSTNTCYYSQIHRTLRLRKLTYHPNIYRYICKCGHLFPRFLLNKQFCEKWWRCGLQRWPILLSSVTYNGLCKLVFNLVSSTFVKWNLKDINTDYGAKEVMNSIVPLMADFIYISSFQTLKRQFIFNQINLRILIPIYLCA